jgi:hypothetical protein
MITGYETMKMIIKNLAEFMNTPNDELEDMMGISWHEFWELYHSLTYDDKHRGDEE